MTAAYLPVPLYLKTSYLCICAALVVTGCGGDGIGTSSSSAIDTPSKAEEAEVAAKSEEVSHLAGLPSSKMSDEQLAEPEGPFSSVKPIPIDQHAVKFTLQHVSKTQVKLTVENTSNFAIGWDKDCSVFVKWSVTDGDGVPVASDSNPRSHVELDRRRFVQLKPGEKYEQSLDLSDGFSTFLHARRILDSPTGGVVAIPEGSEVRKTYRRRRETDKLKVSMQYDTSDSDARDAFSVYFGMRPSEFGIKYVRATSNVVTLEL